MQEYIEAHLTEKITMAQLARAARYSKWHAARMFKDVTGVSPFEYIRKRRLCGAAKTLKETRAKVIDVAFDFVFDSHEGHAGTAIGQVEDRAAVNLLVEIVWRKGCHTLVNRPSIRKEGSEQFFQVGVLGR